MMPVLPLVGELRPKRGVIRGIRSQQAPHLRAGALTSEELARAVSQKFLTLSQTELHGGSFNSFWAGPEQNAQ